MISAEKSKSEWVDRVVERVRARLDGEVSQGVEAFVRQLYAHVPPADLLGDSPDNLAGAALSFWQLAQERKPGAPRIRIYNPRAEEHGWDECEHETESESVQRRQQMPP